jgi:hypothetical protein
MMIVLVAFFEQVSAEKCVYNRNCNYFRFMFGMMQLALKQ